jgi:hypothetical protein
LLIQLLKIKHHRITSRFRCFTQHVHLKDYLAAFLNELAVDLDMPGGRKERTTIG